MYLTVCDKCGKILGDNFLNYYSLHVRGKEDTLCEFCEECGKTFMNALKVFIKKGK